jgi:hypothetical protein
VRASKILIKGQKLGKVTIVGESHEVRVSRRRYFCECDCGHKFVRHYRCLISRADRGDEGCEECSGFVRRSKRTGICVTPTRGREAKPPCRQCWDLPHRRGSQGCSTCGEPPGDDVYVRPSALVSSAGMWSL